MDVNEKLFNSSRQYEGNFTKADLKNLQRNVLLKISDWFHELSENVNLREPSVPWLKTFRDHVQRNNIGIISFNWDLVLEQLLFGEDLNGESYGFPLEPFMRPALIKPHGSLNWFKEDVGQHISRDRRFLLSEVGRDKVHAFRKFRAPQTSVARRYTPFIVPLCTSRTSISLYLVLHPAVPDPRRHEIAARCGDGCRHGRGGARGRLPIFTEFLCRRLWQKCTRLLSQAERVVFLGYSMPEADFHAHFIMRCGFQNQIDGELVKGGRRKEAKGPAEVVVVNTDTAVAKRVAAIVGPKHSYRSISSSVADVVWKDL